jgi:hypothetical protein
MADALWPRFTVIPANAEAPVADPQVLAGLVPASSDIRQPPSAVAG